MDNFGIDWSKATPVITAAVGGLVMWAALAGRKAIKNLGKTEVEIDEAELAAAEKAVEDAKKTPDAMDDKKAAELLANAQARLKNAKRWQAVADAVGDTNPPTS